MNTPDSQPVQNLLQQNDGEMPPKRNPELSAAERTKRTAEEEYKRATAMLEDIASGKRNNPADFESTKQFRTDAYSDALIIFLSHHLGIPRQKVVSLALGFTARQLTNRTVTSQNELAVLLHGLQYAVQDLAIEAREFRELAVSVADQESYIMDPPKP
jgi:hypothetical protein